MAARVRGRDTDPRTLVPVGYGALRTTLQAFIAAGLSEVRRPPDVRARLLREELTGLAGAVPTCRPERRSRCPDGARRQDAGRGPAEILRREPGHQGDGAAARHGLALPGEPDGVDPGALERPAADSVTCKMMLMSRSPSVPKLL